MAGSDLAWFFRTVVQPRLEVGGVAVVDATDSDSTADSSAASPISKYTFEWIIPSVTDGHVETKSFVMPVQGMDVTCYAGFFKACRRKVDPGLGSDVDSDPDSPDFSDDECCTGCTQQQFFYELIWPDRMTKPLIFSCEVNATSNGAVVWSDRKATSEGGHVSTFAVNAKGTARLNVTKGSVKFEFAFEFSRWALEDRPMSMAELGLPLLDDNTLSDVVVVCGDKAFDCHKVILAGRSEVFRRMLTGSFKEAEEGKIDIKDVDPDVVKIMIDFMYRDDVAEDAVSWELFDLAKMYALPRLQSLCLRSLRRNLNVSNCCQMLEAAFRHDLDETFCHAAKFVREHRTEVARTDGWKIVTANSALLEKFALHPS